MQTRTASELAYPPARYCEDHHAANIGWNRSPRTASSQRTSTRAWKLQRAKVLQRDGHQCVGRGPRCLVTASEVDHIQPVAEGGTDDTSNLVTYQGMPRSEDGEDHERHADQDQRQSSISSTRQCGRAPQPPRAGSAAGRCLLIFLAGVRIGVKNDEAAGQ